MLTCMFDGCATKATVVDTLSLSYLIGPRC